MRGEWESGFLKRRWPRWGNLKKKKKQQFAGQQQCSTQIQIHALRSAMQPAITNLFSSRSGFFVGRRNQLVQFTPSFIAIALISTSTFSTLHAHRHRFTLDLIVAQGQQFTGQQQCITEIQLYASFKSALRVAIMGLLFSSISGFFVGRRHQFVHSLFPLSSSSPSSRPRPARR